MARSRKGTRALIGDARDRSQLSARLSRIAAPAPITARALPPGTVDVVNVLFKELQAIFPAWKQAWPDEQALAGAKRSWVKAFVAAGIDTLEQIRHGLLNCRQFGGNFAPSVGRFITWCQPTPESLGLPSYDKAFGEVLENAHPSRFGGHTWSHSAVRHAALQGEMRNFGELMPEQARAIFGRAYAITLRLLIERRPLGDIAIGIGHGSQKTEAERAEAFAARQQAALLEIQGIPSDGVAARTQLMARFKGHGGSGLSHAFERQRSLARDGQGEGGSCN
ncbi:Replication protein P [Pseudomonas capeferrum]|uniref:replication protein P n=1 Tax=Pseudomonas capeferrum TaxID=1495066 RepID=UPI0015E39FBC|nr:replication protein P [Pseudomonas capeferrum]MBA1200376.1 Replication protein P [Pseudomonas capeferrum]